MHGFPDNVHLYDRLVPQLSPPRRIVTFDFLGWGASDKPAGYPYTVANQALELAAVIEHLELKRAVLVAHDASGPPAIDWALAQPERVTGLVLLNTMTLVSADALIPRSDLAFLNASGQNYRSACVADVWWYSLPSNVSVAKSGDSSAMQLSVCIYIGAVSTIRGQAEHVLFFRLNEDLLPAIRSRTKMIPALQEFKQPVRIIFGDADPYLNEGVAQSFHQLFPPLNSCLFCPCPALCPNG